MSARGQLNYHHLFHFWRVAREGSLTRAAEREGVSHATLSVQIKALEEALGDELFVRRGRHVVLTPIGEQVADYADEVFRLGSEIFDLVRAGGGDRRVAFRVGVVGELPKTLAYALLRPALVGKTHRPLVVLQRPFDALLEELAAGRLHLILSDVPPPAAGPAGVFVHELGQSGVLLFGAPALARARRARFPRSLDGAPMILPARRSYLGRQIDRWLIERGIRVRVEAEVEDAGQLRVLGLHGHGLFPVREALRTEVEDGGSRVELVGRLDGINERYYAVSSERRVRHGAVAAVLEGARARLGKGR